MAPLLSTFSFLWLFAASSVVVALADSSVSSVVDFNKNKATTLDETHNSLLKRGRLWHLASRMTEIQKLLNRIGVTGRDSELVSNDDNNGEKERNNKNYEEYNQLKTILQILQMMEGAKNDDNDVPLRLSHMSDVFKEKLPSTTEVEGSYNNNNFATTINAGERQGSSSSNSGGVNHKEDIQGSGVEQDLSSSSYSSLGYLTESSPVISIGEPILFNQNVGFIRGGMAEWLGLNLGVQEKKAS